MERMSREQAFLEAQKLYEKQIVELETELASKVDLLESEKSNLFRTLEEANDELAELKQQLAEKDKEYTRLHNELKLKCEYIREIVAIKDEYKQKLNTQPKEIVEKIYAYIKENFEPLEGKLGSEGSINREDFAEFLEEILKEYEEK